jgi:hypothetical protein
MLSAIEDRAVNPEDSDDAYILATSAAYELQQLYTGFEKIVERHFTFNGIKPSASDRYHKDLLLQAIKENLVTTKVNRDFLTDLLGFRHFVRSAYGVELDTAETFRKVKKALKRWPSIASKLKQTKARSRTNMSQRSGWTLAAQIGKRQS